jgi:membrane fusion protein (multidrug efflux system)
MKRTYWSLIAATLMIAIAAGCGNPPPTPPVAVASTAPSDATKPASAAGTVSASVVVEPARTSDLAFLIAARVKEVKIKEGDQVKAGQALVVLDTPDLQYALVSAKAEADSALADQFLQRSTREYRVWDGRKFIWTHGIQEVRIKVDARLEQALGALDVAQANLAQATLSAPFDGAVVSIGVVPGEMVETNKTVVTIGDLQHLQIATTDLSEREITNVHIGQTATVHLKAFNRALSGKVIAIAPKSEEYKGDTVFKVTVGLDQPPVGLLWGMTGDMEIQTR